MSDQEFRGVAPKSEAGQAILFPSFDLWIGMHRCLVMLIDEGFPPYPRIDQESAELVADMLERRLEFGLVRAYFELCELGSRDAPEDRHSLARRTLAPTEIARVDALVGWVERFMVFLRECGGCKAV